MTNFIAIASIVAMLTSGGGNIQTTGLITENNISSIIQSMENSDYYALTAKVVDVNHKENLVSAELVNRIYDEENDIMVCELKAVNGEFYTLYDFTAPYGSEVMLTLDYDGKVKSVSVTTKIENDWTK